MYIHVLHILHLYIIYTYKSIYIDICIYVYMYMYVHITNSLLYNTQRHRSSENRLGRRRLWAKRRHCPQNISRLDFV